MKRFKYLSITVALLVLFAGLVFAGNKSPMFSRHQPGGMFGVINETQTTGNIWFVDSGSATGADAAGFGENPDAPFLTIDYAIGNCTASNGDWIIVMPGHTDTVSAAGSIAADVAGIRIIGLGEGINRPVISWSAAAGYISVTAANVTFENIVFDMSPGAGLAATGVSIYKTVTDTKFDKCTFLLNNGAGQVTHAIYAEAGGTRIQVANCTFLGSMDSQTGVSDVIQIAAAAVNDVKISGCDIRAYSSNALVYIVSEVSGFQIDNSNLIQGSAVGTNLCIEGASAAGLVRNTSTAYPKIGTGVTVTTGALTNTSAL